MKIPAPALAVSAMLSVQTGAALSTHLFTALSPAGSVWLRLAIAAIILLLITRPRLRTIGWPALRGTLLLGTVTAVLSLAFIEAIARIPLGTAAAIEFLGPLGVAAVRSHRRSALAWPALALAGVIGLTEPWHGRLNLTGVAFAVAAALAWAGYILLTQRVGAQLDGLQGLALSLGTATVVAAPAAAWPALHGLTLSIAAQGLGLAVLVPLLPFAFEMLALRRMRIAAFGTLMALEPGIAAVIGLLLLGQLPAVVQVAGVILVVVAGIGAQRAVPVSLPRCRVPSNDRQRRWRFALGRLIVSTDMTLDGVMDSTDQWFVPYAEDQATAHDQLRAADALLLGRKTYEGLAAVWPAITDDSGFADRVNTIPKLVASRTLPEPLSWNAALIKGDLAQAVSEAKQRTGGNLLMYGCGGLARELARRGLVDEIRFRVHPVVFGRGVRPFHGGEPVRLRLIAATTFTSGVALLCYQPQGS
jgi:inner membrane transporter RhtA